MLECQVPEYVEPQGGADGFFRCPAAPAPAAPAPAPPRPSLVQAVNRGVSAFEAGLACGEIAALVGVPEAAPAVAALCAGLELGAGGLPRVNVLGFRDKLMATLAKYLH